MRYKYVKKKDRKKKKKETSKFGVIKFNNFIIGSPFLTCKKLRYKVID